MNPFRSHPWWTLAAGLALLGGTAAIVFRTPTRSELLARKAKLRSEIEARSASLDYLCSVAGVQPQLLRDPESARAHLETVRDFAAIDFKSGKIGKLEFEQRTERLNALEDAIKERERLGKLLSEAEALKEKLDALELQASQDDEREFRRQLEYERSRDWRNRRDR